MVTDGPRLSARACDAVAGLLAARGRSPFTFRTLQVNGLVCAWIVQGKDLIAAVPPAGHAIGSDPAAAKPIQSPPSS